MQQLTGLDASFVYMETARTPMHIGSVYLLDADQSREFSYAKFREHIRSRLPLVPVFRRRLVEVPLDLGHPFWINDPEFHLDAHLPRVGCPRPGGKRELMELAAQFFARPLNRTRPLWEIAFVDGIDTYPGISPNSFALISRVHHAAVDGMSGAEIMGSLLDLSSDPRVVEAPDPWAPEQLPSSIELVKRSYGKLASKPRELAGFIRDVAAGSVRLAVARREAKIDPPTLPMRAPRTPLNGVISSRRVFGGVEFELQQIKALRKLLPGATVNDILVTICAGGLRRALARHDLLPEESLIAMVPISVRTRGDATGGNQVSAMLVELATDEADPLTRLARVHRGSVSSKSYSSALPANRIMDFVPSEIAALAARLYTRMRMVERHKPFFNLVITNVPGPPMPVYFGGARLASVFGTAPVLDGMGLILVIFSQAGRISIGITAAENALSNVTAFEADLDASFQELVELAASDAEDEAADTDPELANLRAAIAALDASVSRFRRKP